MINQSMFEKLVKQAAKHSPKIKDVIINGYDITVKYASNSGKIDQSAKLIFDRIGKFIVGYGDKSANAPKFLVDNIIKIINNI